MSCQQREYDYSDTVREFLVIAQRLQSLRDAHLGMLRERRFDDAVSAEWDIALDALLRLIAEQREELARYRRASQTHADPPAALAR